MKTFCLVYQAGIANLFHVQLSADLHADGSDPKVRRQIASIGAAESIAQFPQLRQADRVYQGDFRTAEAMARGTALMGAKVYSFGCNMAGDVAKQPWETDLEKQPFSEKFHAITA